LAKSREFKSQSSNFYRVQKKNSHYSRLLAVLSSLHESLEQILFHPFYFPHSVANLKSCRRRELLSFQLEADRISFSFYFSAPENAFFYFSAFYFSAEKDIRIFVSFLFFGTKMAVKKQKKRKSVLWLSQCTAGRTLESPAVAYSRCLHRHPQRQ